MAAEEDDLQLFQLIKVATSSEFNFSTFSSIPGRHLIALFLQCGDVLLYTPPSLGGQSAVRYIPWFEESKKKIQAATFDPTYGTWLLVACFDGSLYVVPALLPFSSAILESLDCDWSFEDITSLPALCGVGKVNDIIPTAIAWWDRLDSEDRCRSIVIVGGKNGEIILANMLSGCVVGRTNVEGSISSIQVCKDDSPLDSPPTFLLITNDSRKQWKLVLEDRESNYSWPFPYEPTRTDSALSLTSGAGSEESTGRPSLASFPLTRARLQGLKQLSVEKLATLRQKITETRNRGLNVSLKRRGSSSSEESVSRYRSSPLSSDTDSVSAKTPCEHHNSSSPRIIPLSETYFFLQTSRGKKLVTGYYAPAQLFTVYGLALNMIPVSVHKLANTCGFILLTDWLLYSTDVSKRHLSIISYRMSQCRLDGDKQILNSDLNPDSVLQEFDFPEGEEVQALYRVTPAVQDRQEIKEMAEEKEFNSSNSHSKKGGSGLAEQSPLDECAVITNKAIYKIVMRKAPRELVLTCVLEPNKIERAEKLCQMFGLDLQQLLETAARRQLELCQLPSALSLYKLARCRPVKSVLHMASAGYTEQLLYLTTALLQTAQLSQSEGLHLANLSVLTFTEQYLRRKNLDKLIPSFKMFLKDNQHYDEVLAVSVVGQSGICSILNFLCDQRGLYTQVLDVLSRIINSQNSIKLDFELCDGFWECLSNEMLCQSLVANPDIAKLHLQFIENKLVQLDEKILQRFAILYDPSQPSVRPVLQRLMLESPVNNIYNSSSSSLGQDDVQFLLSDWLSGYFIVCLYLNRCRRKYKDLNSDQHSHCDLSNCSQTKEGIKGIHSIISAGNTHVALVRNGNVYTWGHSANGCLGIGPTLSQSVTPMLVPLFSLLGIEVQSVSCGKAHTIALTSNGVYSWGSSKYGQLGVGHTNQCPEPRLVEKLYNEQIISVVAGQYHSLALTPDGRLYTWGWGVHGQLGHNNVEDCHYPRWVQGLSSEVCVSCSGGHAHSLVLTTTGRVWAFGSSVFGQLGTGSNAKSSRPVQVFGLPEKICAIATAYFHNLALATSNRLYTWGSSPQILRLQAQAQKKARVQYHQQQQSLAKETSRSVEEMGDNSQLPSDNELNHPVHSDKEEGSDYEVDSSKKKPGLKILQSSRFSTVNSEMVVSPSTEFKGLPTGKAVTEQQSSTFTGDNRTITSGSLVGVDDGLSHLSPTLVDTSHVEGKITQITCGCHHSALLTEKGQVYTWGRNLDAQLGNGARVKEALYPTHITIGNYVELQSIVCGGDFTVGVEAGGRVWGWGSNHHAQLGHLQIEEPARAGLEGCLFMLKTSKRVIKLPHGSLNTVDIPKEVPSLPAVKIEFAASKTDLNKLKSLQHLSRLETPPHDIKTLHYALSYFYNYYNTTKMLQKSVELEDFETAAELATLDKQYDVAMVYQLKAALVKNEYAKTAIQLPLPNNEVKSNHFSLKDKANQILVSTDVIVPTLETSLIVNSESGRKIGLTRSKSNCSVINIESDEVLQTETRSEDQSEFSESSQNKCVKVDEFSEEKSNSEIHMFAVQGGAEEMSTRSQDTLKSDNKSDDILDSRSETPDTLASSCCDEFATKSCDVFDSPVKHFTGTEIHANTVDISSVYENIVNKHIKDVEHHGFFENDIVNTDLVEDLINIVEFYIDLCERGPKTTLNPLLKQGLEFWTNHKLPVYRLESLLLSHWSLVSYPLGVLLLGNNGDMCFDAQQVLSHLSTDFSLQLCSAMVHHTTENSCPEMVELLSGLSWSEQMSARLAGRLGQLSLDEVISQISTTEQNQPYIDLDMNTVLDEDLTSSGEEVISFSCGHRYNNSSSLNKEVLGVARTIDDRSLPNTAQALRSLFQQPLVVRHFACPTCILGCVQLEIE